MRDKATRRSGQIIVILAVLLVAIVAFVAISLDGGLLLDQRRKAQAAADAAALAGACDRYYFRVTTDATTQLKHTPLIAQSNAEMVAALHGYANDGTRSVVTALCPPTSGSHVGDNDFVEVIIQFNQPRGFSTILGTGDLPVRARAVAGVKTLSANAGAIILDRTNSGTILAKGNGNLIFQNGTVVVNSSSASAGRTTGNGSVLAPGFSFSGTPGYSGNFQATGGGTIASGQQPVPDPLAYLPQPDKNSYPTATEKVYSNFKYNGSSPITIYPGRYDGGISITGKGKVTMAAGIYYMNGGGFSITGQGDLDGTSGVMIYNDPAKSNDVISLSGQGEIKLVAPATGIYKGISIFQDRASANEVSVTGNGKYNITGTFYVAGGNLKLAGNGDSGMGSQYISNTLSSVGNGVLNVISPNIPVNTYYLGLAE
jgi:hypothetical protein